MARRIQTSRYPRQPIHAKPMPRYYPQTTVAPPPRPKPKPKPPIDIKSINIPCDLNVELSYKSSGDIGDLTYSLNVLKHYGKGILYLNCVGKKIDGTRSGFTNETIEALRPLLEIQPYISEIKIWKGEKVRYDLDAIRQFPIEWHNVNLCETYIHAFKVPLSLMHEPWLYVEPLQVSPVVFARSNRYHSNNPKIKWSDIVEQYKGQSIYIGLKSEYEKFVESFGYVPYYPTADLLQVARVIAAAETIVANQSAPMSIAVAIGNERMKIIQEILPECPNCMFNRPNMIYI